MDWTLVGVTIFGVFVGIIDANTTAKITATQYAAIKAAVTANNIPVALP